MDGMGYVISYRMYHVISRSNTGISLYRIMCLSSGLNKKVMVLLMAELYQTICVEAMCVFLQAGNNQRSQVGHALVVLVQKKILMHNILWLKGVWYGRPIISTHSMPSGFHKSHP